MVCRKGRRCSAERRGDVPQVRSPRHTSFTCSDAATMRLTNEVTATPDSRVVSLG